ncbi:MAG: WecB/TagA/CpsF family glycosyltransferase [Cyclobacteriaceae bacterium]|nr:WecB/TagA/CpsF family glycosyltransferase [Cyclobacteriaceae bacterium]
MEAGKIRVLGIDFFNGTAQGSVDAIKGGGLLVVPAAPALITIDSDRMYFEALLKSDVAIPDSGYMVMIWNLLKRPSLKRISGWKFLTTFLADQEVIKTDSILMVDPNAEEAAANAQYLRSLGYTMDGRHSYIAPWYKGKVEDKALLSMVENQQPRYIIINLGGGVQEKLGLFLKNNLSYAPSIICTGAAIAFLTGRQANMPGWADKLFLGWLVRCIDNPKVFVPRYLKAFRLITLILQHGQKAPI